MCHRQRLGLDEELEVREQFRPLRCRKVEPSPMSSTSRTGLSRWSLIQSSDRRFRPHNPEDTAASAQQSLVCVVSRLSARYMV
jgi:hypothetical protein